MSASYRGRVETVTPEMAVRWLEKNTANRNIFQSRVDAIADDIRADKWILTGDPIRFGADGELYDGQHRLWAIVQADMPVEVYVVRGLPPEAKMVIDTGAKRTLSNYFQITKEKNPPLLAGILNVVYVWNKNGFSHATRGPTHAEADAFLLEHPEIRDSVTIAAHARNGLGGGAPSPMGGAHAINAAIDAESADEFWERVADGIGLDAGNPVLAYRRWVTKTIASRLDKPSTRTAFAHAMKAMAAWREGKNLRALSWRLGDPMPPDWTTLKAKR